MTSIVSEIKPKKDLSSNPYSDVAKTAWYAPYAYLTNKKIY